MNPIVVEHGHETLRRIVALTFDDGPSEWTGPILDHLRGHSAPATFFLLGGMLEGREDLVRRMVAEGHELGNHGFSHRLLTTLDEEEIRREVVATKAAIARIVSTPVNLWRPPYFAYDRTIAGVACEAGFRRLVLCSVDPRDWSASATAEGIVSSILEQIRPGSIVDLHDGRPGISSKSAPTRRATVEAVERLLPELSGRGYTCATVSELLGSLGSPPGTALEDS